MTEGPPMITRDGSGKLLVKLRRKLQTEEEAERFSNELSELIGQSENALVFDDFDIAQNPIPLGVYEQIFSMLADSKAHVERFRAFGCPTFDDQACVLLAAWLSGIGEDHPPFEMHLSDNAITSEGFHALMEALETNETFPAIDPRNPTKALPLYLRLECNYIDEDVLQGKVDEGTVMTFRKSERISGDVQAKCRLLVHQNGTFQQKSGTPPAPEDAPPPKFVQEKGKGKGKDSEKGNGKENGGKWGKGKDEAPWRRSEGKGKSKGKGQGDRDQRSYAALGYDGPRKTIEKPSKGSGKSGKGKKGKGDYGQHHGSDGYSASRPTSVQDRGRDRPVFIPRQEAGRSGRAGANGKNARPSSVAKQSKGGLPFPWEEHWSDEYGLNYYWNSKTGESLWEKPKDW